MDEKRFINKFSYAKNQLLQQLFFFKLSNKFSNYFLFICSKSFTLRVYLKRHLQMMHQDEMQHCKYCSSKFENKEFLQIHCDYYHKEDMEVAQLKLTCNYCDKLMGSNLKLQQHISLHHPTLRFQCSDCDDWFSTLLNQRLHFKRQHSQ
jgi:hypothetical protein